MSCQLCLNTSDFDRICIDCTVELKVFDIRLHNLIRSTRRKIYDTVDPDRCDTLIHVLHSLLSHRQSVREARDLILNS